MYASTQKENFPHTKHFIFLYHHTGAFSKLNSRFGLLWELKQQSYDSTRFSVRVSKIQDWTDIEDVRKILALILKINGGRREEPPCKRHKRASSFLRSSEWV